jgi:hypothetical protein
MTQAELDQEVAQATGESVDTIAAMGFVPLLDIPFEPDRAPLTVDWDQVDASRQIFPIW